MRLPCFYWLLVLLFKHILLMWEMMKMTATNTKSRRIGF